MLILALIIGNCTNASNQGNYLLEVLYLSGLINQFS